MLGGYGSDVSPTTHRPLTFNGNATWTYWIAGTPILLLRCGE